MKWAKNCLFWCTKIHIYVNKTWKIFNQRACYNRIWSWSPMPCEKHGPRASVTTKTSAFGLGFCLLSPSGHVFHTAWETMIKSYNMLWVCFTWNAATSAKYSVINRIINSYVPCHELCECWIFPMTIMICEMKIFWSTLKPEHEMVKFVFVIISRSKWIIQTKIFLKKPQRILTKVSHFILKETWPAVMLLVVQSRIVIYTQDALNLKKKKKKFDLLRCQNDYQNHVPHSSLDIRTTNVISLVFLYTMLFLYFSCFSITFIKNSPFLFFDLVHFKRSHVAAGHLPGTDRIDNGNSDDITECVKNLKYSA